MNPAAYEGKALVKDLVFHRGKAPPNTGYYDGDSGGADKGNAPVKSFWGIYVDDYQGSKAMYDPKTCAQPVVTSSAKWSQTTTTVIQYTNNILRQLIFY